MQPSTWQRSFSEFDSQQRSLLPAKEPAKA
jgi:hypothetical protein